MWNILSLLQRNLVWAVPAAILSGIAWGLAFESSSLSNLVLPLTWVMVLPMMVSLRIQELAHVRDWRLQTTTQILNFLAIPLLAWAAGLWLFADRPLVALGLLLTALLPTSGMTITWTGLAKGNVPAAVRMTLAGLLLGSILAPFYLEGLLGASVEISMAKVFAQILLTVLLPLMLGAGIRAWLVRGLGPQGFQASVQPRLGALSTVGVLGTIFVAMALKARDIASRPQDLLGIFAVLVALYFANFALGVLVGRRSLFPRQDAIALLYGTAMRNLSIALAIALSAFGSSGPDIAMVVSLAYIVQVQMASWSVRLVPRFFP